MVFAVALLCLVPGCSERPIASAASTGQGMSSAGVSEAGVQEKGKDQTPTEKTKTMDKDTDQDSELKTATFGNGCFWCTEAVFQRVKGVKSVESGFSGGHVKDPDYYEVCKGTTGHAEVLQIQYDPEVVSFEKLLEVFWKTHDPTTLNRQGNDVGPQYRSAVFYHDDQQKELAAKYKKKLDESGAFDKPIVTEITKFDAFYPASEDHQNYYNRMKALNPYCRMIQFKLEKFRKAFGDVIDEEKDKVK